MPTSPRDDPEPPFWQTAMLDLMGHRHAYAFTPPAPAPGQPVSLLAFHGFGTSGFRTYRFLAPQLRAAGIPLYAPDLLGFGGSDKPAGGYSLRRYAALADAFADALSLERPVLVGHSMGAKIAAAAAALYPHRFAGLILINPGGFHPLARLNTVLAERAWVLRLFEHEWFFRGLLPRTPLGAVFQSDANRSELRRLHGSHAALDLDATGLRPQLRALALPSLLLWGEDDRLLLPGTRRAVERTLPGIEVVRMPGAGHAPMKDRPDALSAAIERFVRTRLSGTNGSATGASDVIS